MGNTNTLQSKIGSHEFMNESFVSDNSTNLCSDTDSKCTLKKEDCGFWVNLFANFVNALGLGGSFVKCPLEYYECKDNVLILDKLLSGFYSGQKVPSGENVDKPKDKGKCSHGGILDGSSFVAAEGGINKDSGYTVFSPHASLHRIAADLAINHTQLFFDEIRYEIGNNDYNTFLKLNIDESKLNKVGDVLCSTYLSRASKLLMFGCIILITFLNYLSV